MLFRPLIYTKEQASTSAIHICSYMYLPDYQTQNAMCIHVPFSCGAELGQLSLSLGKGSNGTSGLNSPAIKSLSSFSMFSLVPAKYAHNKEYV